MASINLVIEKFLNYIGVPIVFLSLCIILPPLLVFRFLLIIKSCFFTECMKDKVVLITGASSGIGENMAYEYAKRGASLVIVARRENLLKEVAERAMGLGSPEVLPICADVSNVNECKHFVDKAIDHFGRLDHLVNNAGITCLCTIEDATDITKFEPVMDINFWGSIYPTYFAIPHLKKTKGRIVINASASALLNPPGLGFYAASKAALMSFYEVVRVEVGASITVTILNLGFIESEITQSGKYLTKEGVIESNPILAQVYVPPMLVMKSETCVKTIVDRVCQGAKYVTEPKWFKLLIMLKQLCPELFEWYYHTFLLVNAK